MRVARDEMASGSRILGRGQFGGWSMIGGVAGMLVLFNVCPQKAGRTRCLPLPLLRFRFDSDEAGNSLIGMNESDQID